MSTGEPQPAIVTITTGPLKQNGFVVLDSEGQAVIIDPGGEADRFRAALEEAGAKPLAILATHGHFDHVGAAQDLVEAFDIPFLLHPADHALVKRANLYAGAFGGGARIRAPDSVTAIEGDALEYGNLRIACRHTPGHTPGGMCFEISGALFSGDTLLPRQHPANKLPGAQPDLLNASLALIRTWPRDLAVHPGHGRSRTLGDFLEKIDGIRDSTGDGRD